MRAAALDFFALCAHRGQGCPRSSFATFACRDIHAAIRCRIYRWLLKRMPDRQNESVNSSARGQIQNFADFAVSHDPVSQIVRREVRRIERSSRAAGIESLPGQRNYIVGNDPTRWNTQVRHSEVIYENIYPGIDLTFYGNQSDSNTTLSLKPGVDPRTIRLGNEGARAHLSGWRSHFEKRP